MIGGIRSKVTCASVAKRPLLRVEPVLAKAQVNASPKALRTCGKLFRWRAPGVIYRSSREPSEQALCNCCSRKRRAPPCRQISMWNDSWESKYRETDRNRGCRAAVDDNSCHRHHLVAQKNCACERAAPSPSRDDSCNLLKARSLKHQRPELGATFHSCARALAASESALFCALAEDSEGT